jgi:hypothetical protein
VFSLGRYAQGCRAASAPSRCAGPSRIIGRVELRSRKSRSCSGMRSCFQSSGGKCGDVESGVKAATDFQQSDIHAGRESQRQQRKRDGVDLVQSGVGLTGKAVAMPFGDSTPQCRGRPRRGPRPHLAFSCCCWARETAHPAKAQTPCADSTDEVPLGPVSRIRLGGSHLRMQSVPNE